ncbi:hypothetical protein OGZ51_04925 [Lactococcus lactis]|uniref:Uncharacterized protein n=1 Tax=Lactococcus lactis TaxID=1358 RepID=A0A9X4NG61_9LACT|nr:hypothetical protein [Lactococcus lactis]MDG4983488.1 hypothetical protein [Lactococcus lactis]
MKLSSKKEYQEGDEITVDGVDYKVISEQNADFTWSYGFQRVESDIMEGFEHDLENLVNAYDCDWDGYLSCKKNFIKRYGKEGNQ